MRQEIKPEDLIVTEQDGTRRINHDVLESYGLFNLPKSIMRSALMVYYDNAARQGRAAAQTVRTFIGLASSITRFPKQVAINFTRGAAYRRNMRMLPPLQPVSADPYRHLFETLALGIVFLEPNGVVLDANPAAQRMLGVPLERLRGTSMASLGWRMVLEDGSICTPADIPAYQAFLGGSPVKGAIRGVSRHPGEPTIWLEMDAVPRFRAGEPRPFQICLSFQDVSARQRTSQDFSASQERFRLAMEATRDGIWDWNVDTGEVFYNPGYTRMLGWEPEEFRDRVETWSDLIHPEDRERVLEVNQACIDGRIPQFEVEYRIRTRAGEWKWILGRGKRIVGEGREPARRLVGTHVDISERKHAEQMQRMYEEELQQAQKLESLGSLAGGVAHDMNNILAAIQAVTQTLQHRDPGDPGLARGLAAIEKASLRGRDLVQGLTNFARKDLRESTPLDLNALLRDEIELFRRTTLQKVQLTLDLEERLPAVLGERGMLESAVMNLCVNAVEAMPAGGTLTLRTRSLAGGLVELLVADSGEGMAPEVLARAKEPFFTTKPVGKGTGLGLALVHATVKAHGGTLTLQSEVGRGCTVRVQLPALSSPGGCPAAVPAPAPGRNPLRILLVDDDELIRATVPPMLQLLEHRVTAVAGGGEALQLLAAGEAFDLVVLDLNMPGMNGAETLSQMRRRHPRLPVLMATGHLDEATARMLRRDPRAAGLAKPFSMAELDRKLQELGF